MSKERRAGPPARLTASERAFERVLTALEAESAGGPPAAGIDAQSGNAQTGDTPSGAPRARKRRVASKADGGLADGDLGLAAGEGALTAGDGGLSPAYARRAQPGGGRTLADDALTQGSPDVTAAPERPEDESALLDELFAHGREYLAYDRFATIGDASTFFTKIVGVTFEGRQNIVAGLRGDEPVELVRRPDNEHDPNAIEVRFGMLQLGYLRREIARRLAPRIDAGDSYVANVSGVTGGRNGRSTGVNLHVRRVGAGSGSRTRASVAPLDAVDDAVRRALIGEHAIRAPQARVLERVNGGANTLAVMGTGRGKSLCFQLPAAERALERRGKTLVFYPLRALANDQHDVLVRKLGPLGVRILRANGAIDGEERAELDAALESGEWDVILSTPEFAEYHREAFARPCNRPSLVVVDEAHHIFDSSHRPAYRSLGELITGLDAAQVLALTATAGDATFAHVRAALRIERWVIDPTVRENLHVVDARGTQDRLRYLRGILDGQDKAIVYCCSRNEATSIAERLRDDFGDGVAFYHAGVPSTLRGAIEDMFRGGRLRVVVATSAFGEGIDLPDVRHVVLYHLNFSFTEFNQQAGRAGRDGLDARIHLLYGEPDRRINDYIIAKSAPTIGTLREIYKGLKGLASDDVLRLNAEDVARTLELDIVDGRTIAIAVRIFEDAGLVATGIDDDGRFVRFLPASARVDLTRTTRFAEGQAERDSFERFCTLALSADAETLEAVINRPIYPDDVPLER
jgi:single-stranded-DNA-specific exonuclease